MVQILCNCLRKIAKQTIIDKTLCVTSFNLSFEKIFANINTHVCFITTHFRQ